MVPEWKIGENQIVIRDRPGQKNEKLPVSLLENRNSPFKFLRFPRDSGIFPALKRDQKFVEFRSSHGTDHPEK